MRKSLGQYNIEKSSSSDVNNISWSQKKQKEKDIPRKKKVVKKTQIPPGTNIIYKKNEDKKTVKKTFTIENKQKLEKPKEEISKKHENTSSTLGQVKGKAFERPGR